MRPKHILGGLLLLNVLTVAFVIISLISGVSTQEVTEGQKALDTLQHEIYADVTDEELLSIRKERIEKVDEFHTSGLNRMKETIENEDFYQLEEEYGADLRVVLEEELNDTVAEEIAIYNTHISHPDDSYLINIILGDDTMVHVKYDFSEDKWSPQYVYREGGEE